VQYYYLANVLALSGLSNQAGRIICIPPLGKTNDLSFGIAAIYGDRSPTYIFLLVHYLPWIEVQNSALQDELPRESEFRKPTKGTLARHFVKRPTHDIIPTAFVAELPYL
jgi:hypothetical protein